MKIRFIAASALTLMLWAGCAATSVKQTSVSPSFQGKPVNKMAILVMTERDFYRQAIENRFFNVLSQQGQNALTTHEILHLADVRADRPAAAARLRQTGADSVLIVRLVDTATYSKETRAGSAAFTSSVAESYSYLAMGPGPSWNSMQTDVYLESSLHELAKGDRIWSGVTRTVLKEDTDTLEKIEPLAKKLFELMRRDGVIH